VDSFDNKYAYVGTVSTYSGTYNGKSYMEISGLAWSDLPPIGAVQVVNPYKTNGDPNTNYLKVFRYDKKLAFPTSNRYAVQLASITYSDDCSTWADCIIQLLHQEYVAPVVRLQFSESNTKLQFITGMLDVTNPYTYDAVTHSDDMVRGLFDPIPSRVYDSTIAGFIIRDGSDVGGWNRLRVLEDNSRGQHEVWIWWNDMLIQPVSFPYFGIFPTTRYGKVALRLWPGAVLRRMSVMANGIGFSKFTPGHIGVSG
jgi:hypothetical protein